jgi:hypothetical protein
VIGEPLGGPNDGARGFPLIGALPFLPEFRPMASSRDESLA